MAHRWMSRTMMERKMMMNLAQVQKMVLQHKEMTKQIRVEELGQQGKGAIRKSFMMMVPVIKQKKLRSNQVK